MRTLMRGVAVLGLVAVGYVLGASNALHPGVVRAQQAPGDPSQEAVDRIKEANNSIAAAAQALKTEGRYTPAIDAPNPYAVLSGGVNAINDLETRCEVDPITFAGLYAGYAVSDVAKELSYDDQNRLMYKDKLVRMYSVSRLKQMFATRARLNEEEM